MSQNLTIKLKQSEMKRLTELEDTFPPDSFTDYDKPEDLKASFERALADWRSGRVQNKL